MDVFEWIASLLLPAIQLLTGGLMRYRPSPERNLWYGYRTRRSMATPQAWALAQRLCGAAWLRWGTVTALLILLSLLLLPLPPAALTMVHLLAGLVSLFAPIPRVERALEEHASSGWDDPAGSEPRCPDPTKEDNQP